MFTDPKIIEVLIQRDTSQVDSVVTFLYRMCQNQIKHMVISNNGSQEDAKDIVQEVIITFINQVTDGRFVLMSSVKISTYLYTLARNIWLKQLEREGKRKEWERLFIEIKAEMPEDKNPQELMIEMQENESYLKVFQKLGRGCQQLLKAFYGDNKSMEHIAIELDLGTAENARVRKFRCMQELKRLAQL